MKKKTYSSNLVTKDFLRKELDITIERLLHGIRQEITFTIETVVDKFEKKLNKHTSLILTTVDPLLKELETRREDREIAAAQFARTEKRIKKLEEVHQLA